MDQRRQFTAIGLQVNMCYTQLESIAIFTAYGMAYMNIKNLIISNLNVHDGYGNHNHVHVLPLNVAYVALYSFANNHVTYSYFSG